MASRMKKIFHRKKDSDTEQPSQPPRAPRTDRNDPALRTSLYESTEPGQLPQTGDYPVRGNDNSVIFQQGRKSSVSRSRRNSGASHGAPYRSTTPNQYEVSKRAPHMTPPPVGAGSNDPYRQSPAIPMGGQEQRRRREIPQDFSRLNLDHGDSPTTVTQTVTTTTRTPHQVHNEVNRSTPQTQEYGSRNQEYTSRNSGTPQTQEYASRNSGIPRDPRQAPRNNAAQQHQEYAVRDKTTPQHQAYALRNTTSPHQEYASKNNTSSPTHESAPRNNADNIRPDNETRGQGFSMAQPYRDDSLSSPRSNAYDAPNLQDGDDAGLVRQNSIPRKKISTSASVPYSSVQASSSRQASSPPMAQPGHSRQQSGVKPLPSTPAATSPGYTEWQPDPAPQSSSVLNRSRPISSNPTGLRDAQAVVDRAKTNTCDTQVVESVAPAVVHESVHRAVHHVREEVVTREIHTHDVYHRIQPIIDVEVLPPRHFLPVEGGGLVEISAQEVPGRGSNWVIAETASKIPSDQAAPPGTTQFTARRFPGREGDAVKYMSPEGYEKTEQTWVHPPELEEGARLTGQSWPMIVGESRARNGEHGFSGAHGFSTPKSTQRKSPKNNPPIQASPAQRASGGAGKA